MHCTILISTDSGAIADIVNKPCIAYTGKVHFWPILPVGTAATENLDYMSFVIVVKTTYLEIATDHRRRSPRKPDAFSFS